jgi:hypothetical protein
MADGYLGDEAFQTRLICFGREKEQFLDVGDLLDLDDQDKSFLADRIAYDFDNEQLSKLRRMLPLQPAGSTLAPAFGNGFRIRKTAPANAGNEHTAITDVVETAHDGESADREMPADLEQNDADTIPTRPVYLLEQPQKEQAMTPEFLSAWKRKMDLARLHSKRYKMTEERLRHIRWQDLFYIDNNGYLSIWKEVYDRATSELTATDPRYKLQTCRWHKFKTPPRRAMPGIPTLVVTDPEGRRWYPSDLSYYYDDSASTTEDDSDGAVY